MRSSIALLLILALFLGIFCLGMKKGGREWHRDVNPKTPKSRFDPNRAKLPSSGESDEKGKLIGIKESSKRE